MILTLVILGLLFLGIAVYLGFKSYKSPIVSGREELIGSIGQIVIIQGEERPRVRIRGELWQVSSDETLQEGQRVKVVALDELILIVMPLDPSQTTRRKV